MSDHFDCVLSIPHDGPCIPGPKGGRSGRPTEPSTKPEAYHRGWTDGYYKGQQDARASSPQPDIDGLDELIEKAHDPRNSDEWIGNIFRALVGRGSWRSLPSEPPRDPEPER